MSVLFTLSVLLVGADIPPAKENVALDKPTAAKSHQGGNVAALAFDGKDYTRFPSERGERVDRGAAPAEFRQLCEFFRARPDVTMIHAWAFPVTKK